MQHAIHRMLLKLPRQGMQLRNMTVSWRNSRTGIMMGNSFGSRAGMKPISEARKNVYLAQDTFLKTIMDTQDGDAADDSDDDTERSEQHENDDSSPLMPPGETNRRKKLNMANSNIFSEADHKVAAITSLEQYVFPFENLVFEGGGTKGVAYCGCVQVLEELGLMQNIKRFAGTSAGAMAACLLAVGYDSAKLEEFLSQDLSKIFIDHSFGYLSLLPNLIRGYGWNPGNRTSDWLGMILKEKTGDADITFSQVYWKYGKELCVVVTNLNTMTTVYFHQKTTPDMPVRVAVRMSVSIPGLFQAVEYEVNGHVNTYVDGGMFCNYPIHCYDGWWLSMKTQDSFLTKMQPLEDYAKMYEKKERFGTYNEKTMGFLVYADDEIDTFRNSLQTRVGTGLLPYPKTELAKEKLMKKEKQETAILKYSQIGRAVNAFMKILSDQDVDHNGKIGRKGLSDALNDTEAFPKRYAERLFGKDVTVDNVLAALDEDDNGVVDISEIVQFSERNGLSLQNSFLGYSRKEINGVASFFEILLASLLQNVSRLYSEEQDVERTVGINTGHVGTTDFEMDELDKKYAINQGRRSTEAFLKYYVVNKKPARRNQSGA